MLIQSYGLFWDRDGVEWNTGPGRPRHLWGRRNQNRGTLRVADVWSQKGLYVLYSFTGPYYVGITTKRPLGVRLAEHTRDSHQLAWVRFSWFGFHPLTDDPWSVNRPETAKKPKAITSGDVLIRDMEALLIKSMGTWNVNDMNFNDAKSWLQIPYSEVDKWRIRIDP